MPFCNWGGSSRAGKAFFVPVAVAEATKGNAAGRSEVRKMRDEIVASCDNCGFEIYDGEPYYRINGEVICRDCLGEYAARLLAPFQIGGET